MKRSMRAISACCLSIALPSAISRAACSRRQLCQLPAKKRERPASSSSTAVPTASRNQRSWATSTIAASRPVERLLQPLQRLDVEVVGGLVEQQHVRVRGQRARERGARQLPAGERVQRTLQVVLREAQPACHHRRAVAPQVAAERLQARLRAGVAVEQRFVLLRLPSPLPGLARAGCLHTPLQLRQLTLGRELLRAAREHVLAQRDPALARRALVVQRHARALREAQLAAVDRLLPGEHPQQRRLTRAVAPAIVIRSRRSSLNDTPRSSGLPAMSLWRSDAISTATVIAW